MTAPDLSVLYFPTPFVPSAVADRLLLVFDSLAYYQPAESFPAPPDPRTATGRLQGYAPAPLGEDLKRFERLLKDMQSHAAEYQQAYLAELGQEGDAPASWRQVASLLKQTAPAADPREEALWRARLLLALAAMHHRRERELTQGLSEVARKETELLKGLRGDEEELDLPAWGGLEEAGPAAPPERAELLLKAWGRLYLADEAADRPRLLATADPESARLLMEAYRQETGRQPQKLFTLPIPTAGKEGAPGALLADLGPVLDQANREADLADLPRRLAESGILEKWEEAAASLGKPGPTAGVLTFYGLTGVPFARVFGRLCRQETASPAGEAPPHGLLALLRVEETAAARETARDSYL